MTGSSVIDFTPNFKLSLPSFDLRLWHTYVNEDFTIIDAVLGHYLNIDNLVGVWQNSTVYQVGQRAVDPAQGAIWECAIGNTSAPVPTTFAQERVNNPAYWRGVTVPQNFRGVWQNSTSYSANDFVVSGNIYAVCISAHTSIASPGVFSQDAAYWAYLINLTGLTLPPIAGQGGSYVRAMPSETGTEYRTPTQVRADLGLSNVVTSLNTRVGDVGLILSDITNAGGAPLANPGFIGIPTAPTAPALTSTTQIATTAFVINAVGVGGGGAYAVVGTTPPDPLNPHPVPPMGLLFADTSVGDATVGPYLPLSGGTVTGPLTANGAVTLGSSISGGGLLNDAGRNKLHNAMFRVQQRGTSFPGLANTNSLTADRWRVASAVDTAVSASIVALADSVRTQIGDEEALYSLAVATTGNAGAGSSTLVIQPIEGVRRLGGKTVTVSFWAQTSVSNLKIGLSIDQVFGTGGSPSSAVQNNSLAVFTAPDTNWHRYTATTTLASTSGKTLGSNGDDNTQLNFWVSSGATNAARAGTGVQSGTWQFWGMQLEVGTQATPLEKLDIAVDRMECMRFCQVGVPFLSQGYQVATGGYQFAVPLSPPMRAAPATTITTNSNSNISSFALATSQTALWNSGQATATGTVLINIAVTLSADL